MATHPHRAAWALEAEPPGWRLTEALDAKLAELKDRGFEVRWIESSAEDLALLAVEGGEDAVRLDPDPSVDRAWYGGVEIRVSATRALTWVFLTGEADDGEISAHVLGPPDPAAEQGPDAAPLAEAEPESEPEAERFAAGPKAA
jgi:hypothetical protein